MEESQDMFRSLTTLGQVGIRLLRLPDLYPFQKEACVSLWDVGCRARERKAAGGDGLMRPASRCGQDS